MKKPCAVDELKSLRIDVDENYQKIKEIADSLVGSRILFIKGTKKAQMVYADVEESLPHSLYLRVYNFETKRRYNIDINSITIKRINYLTKSL